MPYSKRSLLGLLTPSSNTVLEPTSARILAQVPNASAHFTRLRLPEIALRKNAPAKFRPAEIIQAASLLRDTKCRVIAWTGTSAAWLGFQTDQSLCHAITAETGAASCSAVLALNEILSTTGATRIGLVTPYLDDLQARIVANYKAIGVDVAAEVHFGLEDDFSFSELTEAAISDAVHDVAAAGPQAIVVLGTNLRGARLAHSLEAELGIPLYDSVSAVLWKSLLLCGEDAAAITGWGRVFALPGQA